MKATIYGAGSFGTAIAAVLSNTCDEVVLWGRDAAVVDAINQRHENPSYLPGLTLAPNISATTALPDATQGAELIVTATPSHATRELMAKLTPLLTRHVPIVTVAKGIENESLLTMTEVLEQCLPDDVHPYIAVLSGPSFAKEMVQKLPTLVTIAARW